MDQLFSYVDILERNANEDGTILLAIHKLRRMNPSPVELQLSGILDFLELLKYRKSEVGFQTRKLLRKWKCLDEEEDCVEEEPPSYQIEVDPTLVEKYSPSKLERRMVRAIRKKSFNIMEDLIERFQKLTL